MSIDINLISKSKSEGSNNLQLKKIRIISFLTLFIVGFFSVAIFLLNLRFSANSVREKQNKLTSELSVYKQTSTKIFVLNNRISDIFSVLSQRKEHHETIERIFEDSPSSLTVRNVEINEGGISINVTSESLLDLNIFLNHIISLSKSKTVSNVRLEGLSIESSVYSMIIKVS